MRNILGLMYMGCFSLYSLTQASNPSQVPPERPEWVLIYQNDPQGKSLHGKVSDLINAVRTGVPIRVGWASKRLKDDPRSVEHVANASFLTVLSSEVVVAQIDKIFGQKPNFTDKAITFHDAPLFYWSAMFASNGKAVMMTFDPETGKLRNQQARPFGTLWFALLPSNWQNRPPAKPLFAP